MNRNQLERNQNQAVEDRVMSGSERGESMPYIGAAVPVGLVGATVVAI